MKTRALVVSLVVVAAIVGAGAGAYWIGMSRGMKMAMPAGAAEGAAGGAAAMADSGRKVLYWHDPMVPGQKFDKPGKSPFMDMQLVPVYANEGGDDDKTIISPRVQQNLGMRTAEVVRGSLSSGFTAVGSVAYNDRDVVLIQVRTGGFVEKLHVRAPLDPVRKGDALVDLYVPEWVAAQEEFFAVRRMQGRGIEGLVDGARQRMRLAGMTDEQVRTVEESGKVQARFIVTAPISGVVTELMVREGMTVMPGASLFRINGIGTIWVNAEVPENLSGQVRPGATVSATTPSIPGKVFKGTVSRLLPEVNAVTRTIKARIELANPAGQLTPGMFAAIAFAGASRSNVLLVPTEAVIQTGQRTVVIVALGQGKFSPVNVEIGPEIDGKTEIRKGLQAGQSVVVSGQFLIDSEANLRAATTRLSEPQTMEDAKPAGMTGHRGEGRIEQIEKDEITLSHGPIPSLKWGPMTMGFKLPAGRLPKDAKVGDKVTFGVELLKDGMYGITDMAPAGTAMGAKVTDALKAGAMKEPMSMPSGQRETTK